MFTSRNLFPTLLHERAADAVLNFFTSAVLTDTVLVVNSCARGQAVPDSDLDFAILAKEDADPDAVAILNREWLSFESSNPHILDYRKSGPYSHLHLDIIDGRYSLAPIEASEPMSHFEIEVGNQICYSVPMSPGGEYFHSLREKWLPYYSDSLRAERLNRIKEACIYDLDRIPYLLKRGLPFNAFDAFYKAFQEFLQALFIFRRTYPIAYNKWIRYQVVDILAMPEIYPSLTNMFTLTDLAGDELNHKAAMISELLAGLG